MADNKVKLYGYWGSPYSKRVEIALKMKGIEYEYIEEDLRNKSPELLHYNPVHKAVPVLVHGNKSIAESHVIIEYIDEAWDSDACFLPRDPYQRAMSRFWARFIDEKLMPSIVKAFWLGEKETLEETLDNMKILDTELEGKSFFGGESVGFVDVVATTVGYWMTAIVEASGKAMVIEEVIPSVCKWWDEFVKCEGVQETLPPRDKLVTFLKARIALGKIGLVPDRPNSEKNINAEGS